MVLCPASVLYFVSELLPRFQVLGPVASAVSVGFPSHGETRLRLKHKALRGARILRCEAVEERFARFPDPCEEELERSDDATAAQTDHRQVLCALLEPVRLCVIPPPRQLLTM